MKTLILNEKFHIPENLSDELLNTLETDAQEGSIYQYPFSGKS